MRRDSGAIAVLVLFVAGCASSGTESSRLGGRDDDKGTRLPTGLGTPDVTETVRFIEAATQRCTEFESWTGAIAFDGNIAGRRVHGSLLGAFTRPNIRIEATSVSGESPFVVISDGRKTTLRSQRRTFEISDSRDVVQALIGIRIPADVLGRTLVACELPDGFTTMRMFGSLWARLPLGGGSIYLHRTVSIAPWQLVTMFYPGETLQWTWRVDFEDVQNGIPVRSHIVSADGHSDIHFRLSQVDTMVLFQNDDVRFRIDGSPNTFAGSPAQLRDIIYKSIAARN